DEAGVILSDEHNDFLFADASRMEEIEELSANICLMTRIQPAEQKFAHKAHQQNENLTTD
ncbi:hypothetical protein Tco_0233911, partial [Tanacetum coccineum]